MVSASPLDLLTALRRGRAVVVGQVARLLDHAVATAEDARLTARKVGSYFNPWYATRRGPTGGLLRAGRTGAVKNWPGEAGMASAGARRLMLTETSKSHGAAVITRAQRAIEPMGVRWHVAAGHRRADECDDKVGTYRPTEVPPYPTHARCRCWLEPVPLSEVR